MTALITEQGMVRVPAGTWTVDPVHSSAAFVVKHMMISTVRGQFREFISAVRATERPA
jgi:polyisoprenoid-binding protein YceI